MLLVAGCGGGGGGSSTSTSTSAAIGPAGGDIALQGGPAAGAEAEVPAGALAVTTTLEVALGDDVASQVADRVALGAAVRFGPPGLVFAAPVRVSLPFSVAALPAGATVADIVVLKRDDTTMSVIELRPLSVDTVSGIVVVQVTSFSTFQAAAAIVDPGEPASLSMALSASSISEEGGATDAVISRTGDHSRPLVVQLASSDLDAASTPPQVTILAGQPSASFVVSAVDNARLDGTRLVTITALAQAIAPVSAALAIVSEDVDVPPVAADVDVIVDEDAAVAGLLSAVEPNEQSLTYALVDAPTRGALIITNATTGAFSYTPDPNNDGGDAFTYIASDGALDSTIATVTITIAPVNDAPAAIGGVESVIEDNPKSGTLAASDPDSTSFTFTILTSTTRGALALTPSTGAFTYTPDADFAGGDAFTFQVSDGALTSTPAAVLVTVLPVNDAPVASAGSVSTSEDASAIGVLVASDVEGSALTYSIVTPPTKGSATVTNASTGAFTFAPTANANGTDSFTFKANDGALDSAPQTVTISIAPVDDAPVASAGALATLEDTPAAGTLVATDVEGATLTYSIVTPPLQGAAVITNVTTGAFTFTPAANANGADVFTFKVSDGALESGTAAVTISITAVNDPPTATIAALSATEDVVAGGSLAAADVDGDPLVYSIVTGPTKGAITITNASTGAFTFTPTANQNGADAFTFRAFDGSAFSATTTGTISIAAVNDAPVSSGLAISLAEDGATAGTLPGVDVDSVTLTYSIVGAASKGAAAITNAATGAFTYTPGADQNGADSFTFKVNDGALDSGVSTVSVTINAVNDAPVAAGVTITATEDFPTSGALAATDVDGTPLTFSIVTPPTKGVLSITNAATGAFTFTPTADVNGPDSFTFRASDGAAFSNTASGAISIAAINDAPVSTGQSVTLSEDGSTSGTLGGSDIDSATLTFSIVGGAGKGTATVTNAATGAFTYVPGANQNGADSFTFKVNDTALDSNVSTVSITINAVNDAPVAQAQSISTNEDAASAGTLVAADIDSASLTYAIVSNGTRGTAAVTNASTGAFTYTPAANRSGTDTFTFRASDGPTFSAAVSVTVTIVQVNDAPTLDAIAGRTIAEDAASQVVSLAGIGGGGLPDEPAQTLSVIATSDNAALIPNPGVTYTSPNAAGSIAFTPVANRNGVATITVTVTDSGGTANGGVNTLARTFSVTVTAVNDVPVALGDSVTVPRNVTTTISALNGVLKNDLDADGDALTAELVATASIGVLALRPDGSFDYTPPADTTGTATFTYRARDAGVTPSGVTTVAINISDVNNAPVVLADGPYTVAEDGSLTVPSETGVLANDADPEGDSMQAEVVTAPDPSEGVLVLTQDGGFTFTPASNFFGTADFEYRARDTLGSTSGTAIATINVTSVNDDPGFTVTGGLSRTVNEGSGLATINLTAISPGPLEAPQQVSITAAVITESAGGLVTGLAVTTSGFTTNAVNSITFTPGADLFGTATIRITARDQLNATVSQDFALTVTDVNDDPSFTVTGGLTKSVAEDSSGNSIALTAISPGPNESENVSITARVSSSSPAGLVPSVTVQILGFLSGTTNTINFTLGANLNGTADIEITARDPRGGAFVRTIVLTVTPVNDSPSFTAIGTKAATEDTPLVFNVTGIAAGSGSGTSEPESFTSTIQIISDPSGLLSSVSVSPTGATTATTAQLTITPAVNKFGTGVQVRYTVTDQGTGSLASSETFTVNVTEVNDAPVATIGSNSTNEDAAAGGTLAATDVDSASFTFSIVTNGAKGVAAITNASTGAYTYTPNANENGADSFTFKVNDGGLDSAAATISLTIAAINDAPTLNALSTLGINEDATQQTVNLAGIAAGPANESAQTLVVTAVSNNTGLIPNPTVTYTSPNATGSIAFTPVANQSGSATISVTVTDNAATGGGNVNAVTRQFTVNVTAVDDAPVAAAASNSTNEDAAVAGTLGVTDIDSASFTFSIVAQGTKGTAAVTNASTGAYTYTPNANENGSDSFTYKVNDGASDSNTATISMTINSVNDAPVFNALSAMNINEDAGLQTVNLSGISSGAANESAQTLVVTSASTNTGLIPNPTVTYTSPNATGSIAFTPVANQSGSATLSVTITDNGGTANGGVNSIVRQFTVNVAAVNDPPVASNGNLSVTEDVAQNGTLVATDIDDASLVYSIVAQGTKGTAVITNSATGAYTYTPALNQNGADSFTFKANDTPADSNTATISVSITGANDTPVATAFDIETMGPMTGQSAGPAVSFTLQGSDVDGDGLTYTIVANGTKGTVSGGTGANRTYTPLSTFTFPNSGSPAEDTFTYRVNDGAVNSGTVTVRVFALPSMRTTSPVSSLDDPSISWSSSGVTVEGIAVAHLPNGFDDDGITPGDVLVSGSNKVVLVKAATGSADPVQDVSSIAGAKGIAVVYFGDPDYQERVIVATSAGYSHFNTGDHDNSTPAALIAATARTVATTSGYLYVAPNVYESPTFLFLATSSRIVRVAISTALVPSSPTQVYNNSGAATIRSIACRINGDVFFVEDSNLRVLPNATGTPGSVATRVASITGTPGGIVFNNAGNVVVAIDGTTDSLNEYDPNTGNADFTETLTAGVNPKFLATSPREAAIQYASTATIRTRALVQASVSFTKDVYPNLEFRGCSGCHNFSPLPPDAAEARLYWWRTTPSLTRGALFGVQSSGAAGAFALCGTGFEYINNNSLPTNLPNSLILLKVKGTSGCGDRMPQGGPFMSQTEVSILERWILNSAPNN